MSDGSLVFDTKLNNAKFEKGIEEQKKGIEKVGTVSRKTFSEMSAESGKTVEELKQDVKKLAEEYQKQYGLNVPQSYKKAYKDMGLYSKDAREEIEEDAEKMRKSHEESSEKSKKSWEDSFDSIKKGFSSVGSVAKSVFSVSAKAITAAAGATATLGAAAINSYADYEQLVGGIETLFGAGGLGLKEYADSVGKTVSEVRGEYNTLMKAQSLALDNAANAYETAGLSANEYMETVTSIAASLKQSTANELGAAKAANDAIIDMADNANKMGTSMESIQNAYQGFSKQNYTMLDNLKLGYGGTKEEMQRLLKDAEKLTGIKYDINNLSDVYSAIHVIQTELGITGTTAKEATETISGSMNAAKAAWSNLLTGLADDTQDLDVLVDNFVESVAIAGENLLPRIETVIVGTGQLVEELLPVIVAEIPVIVNDVLPDLMQSGINMINSIVEGIGQNLPQILSAGGNILMTLTDGVAQLIPSLGTLAFDLITYLLTSITENAGSVIQSGADTLASFINGIVSKIPDLLNMAVEAILALAMALTDPNTLTSIIDAGINLLVSLVSGIYDAIPKLVAAVPQIIANLVQALIANIPKLLTAAAQIMLKLGEYMLKMVANLLSVVPNLSKLLREEFANMDWGAIGRNIIEGIKNGVLNAAKNLANAAAEAAKAALEAAKSFLGIHSPSTVMRDVIGKNMIAGAVEGVEDETPEFKKSAEKSAEAAVDSMNELLDSKKSHGVLKASLLADADSRESSFKTGFAASEKVVNANNSQTTNNQTVNIYQPVKSPSETARAIRLEQQYGLAGA